jgi:hypothetical protein
MRLRQARGFAGLTQQQVTVQLGTKKSVNSSIENSAANLTVNTLKGCRAKRGNPFGAQATSRDLKVAGPTDEMPQREGWNVSGQCERISHVTVDPNRSTRYNSLMIRSGLSQLRVNRA